MKGVVFALKSLVLMFFASFFAWGVTYVGLKYLVGLDLVWEWQGILVMSLVMGWSISWVPFVVLMWFEEKE
ncbi:TPA: hypothetical protein MA058_003463 [Klebsiella pneumoniae]|nr:hypothetical protein [Klebsiella pneumoniae]